MSGKAWVKLAYRAVSALNFARAVQQLSRGNYVGRPTIPNRSTLWITSAISVSDVKSTVEWYLKNFSCKVSYQDETWALLEFANIRVAFVLPQQHPPHFALLRDPALFGEPKTHRDGTRSVYVSDPSGNSVEVLALK